MNRTVVAIVRVMQGKLVCFGKVAARVRPNGESLIALSQAGQIRDRRTGMDTHCSHISALGRGTVQSGMDRHWDWHGRVWHGQEPQLRIGPSIVARFELEYSAVREPSPSPSMSGKSEPYLINELGLGLPSAYEKRMAL